MYRAAVAALPGDPRPALRWLRRGPLATSPLLPLTVRRNLLRAGGVRLGPMVTGLERCWFESGQVTIEAGAYLNAGCWFEGHGRIVIGRDCLLGPEVMILTSTHALGPDGEVAPEPTYREVRIGERCWLGARVMVLPGVRIGAGTVVAAGAVVTRDCEPGARYAGVPARKLAAVSTAPDLSVPEERAEPWPGSRASCLRGVPRTPGRTSLLPGRAPLAELENPGHLGVVDQREPLVPLHLAFEAGQFARREQTVPVVVANLRAREDEEGVMSRPVLQRSRNTHRILGR